MKPSLENLVLFVEGLFTALCVVSVCSFMVAGLCCLLLLIPGWELQTGHIVRLLGAYSVLSAVLGLGLALPAATILRRTYNNLRDKP